jgi:outer membrane protein assembly factor BamB
VTKDSHVFYGQGSKDSGISSQSQGVAFAKGRRLVVAGDIAFVATDTELFALARASKKRKWKRPSRCPDSMILAGGTLFVGGRDAVMALEAKTGTPVWQAGVDGRAYDLAVADGRLYASTSEGVIYCFAGAGGKAPSKPVAPTRAKPTKENHLAVGPFVEFTGPTTVTVRWDGGRSGSSRLVLSGGAARARSVRAAKRRGLYEAKLTELRPDTVYSYTFQGAKTSTFELDTFFNYSPQPVGETGKAFPARDPGAASSAKAAVASTATDRGICVVLPSGDGGLAYEIARCSRFRVIGVDTDVDKVDSARRALIAAGVYGSRVVIYHVKSLDKLPFVGEFANLVVSTGRGSRESTRLLIPGRGVALEGTGPAGRTQWARKTRPPLKGAGVWTHQYGRADNSAYGGETLAGARSAADFHVQWLGRPGPRYQPDRNGRKPAPLAAGGRLFGQGLERIVAIDAFNGTILWSLEIPPLRRFNIPRDCGNWCADDDHVYAVARDRCWVIDARNGSVTRTCKVIPGPRRTWRYDWGYIADGGDVIVGSAVKQGSAFKEYWGGAGQGWYDAVKGSVTHKICSNALFALDKTRGSRKWYHAGGAIINSTITIGAGTVYFVECANKKIVGLDSSRVGAPELWQDQHMVALDVNTGKTKWRRPIDTADGVVMFSMAHGGGKLVVVASTADKKYEVTAFDADGGSKIWTGSTGWPGGKGDHGKAMSRPAIVEDKVFVRPAVFDLDKGSALGIKMPGGGCGTYAFTKHSAFYRSRTVNMWSFDGGKKSSWARLRPGCWLSTVPALGMVLSPEAGGGCKCANWIETSIAFMPNRAPGTD